MTSTGDEPREKESDLVPVEWTDDDEMLLQDSMRDLDQWPYE